MNKLIVLFGLPGTGKNVAGTILKEDYGFFFYDSDVDQTKTMKANHEKGIVNTVKDIDEYMVKVIQKVKELKDAHRKLVIASWFPLNKHRILFKNTFPETIFILIKSPIRELEERLTYRKNHNITKEYALKVLKIFEKPVITHEIIKNNSNIENFKNEINRCMKKLLKND